MSRPTSSAISTWIFPSASSVTPSIRTPNSEPGDRAVFVTDGALERMSVDVDRLGAILDTRSLHPREAVRDLADRVLNASGTDLRDDATVLCLDWHSGYGRDRDSVHGAEQGRARTPLA